MYKDSDSKWVQILKNKYLNNNEDSAMLTSRNLPQGSKTWNFIKAYINLITNYISWDIHDGRSTLFWEDSWGGFPSLENIINVGHLRRSLMKNWGQCVKDYMQVQDKNDFKI